MSQPTKIEAIKRFLMAKAPSDLAGLYNANMEVQVNVAQDDGTAIQGEYLGKTWRGWTNGIITWKAFRIPYKANTEPEYEDKPMVWPLDEHVEAIGMTGWDWVNRKSRWVAFDFDAIVGHSESHEKRLEPDEIEAIIETVKCVDWVSIRRSTSGKGIHLYIFLDPVDTKNHNEHAALARAILGKLSALTGYDFEAKVDTCGGNMWVWHRKLATNHDGLTLIKQGSILTDIPKNWYDHIKVVKGHSRKAKAPVDTNQSAFELLAGRSPKIKLDTEHKRLIKWLQENGCTWWWEQDYHMLVTHTAHLKEAHTMLGYRGVFDTISTHSSPQNCFCFPLRDGAWVVRRYTPGVNEHEVWEQDGQGWTRTFFNKIPSLAEAARAYNGIEDPKGGYVFMEAELAVKALSIMGINIIVEGRYLMRKTKLISRPDSRVVVELERRDDDNAGDFSGWLPNKKIWTQVVGNKNISTTTQDDTEIGEFDQIVRHLVAGIEDCGWAILSENTWRLEPMQHIKMALKSMGINTKEIELILGSSVFKPWSLVNKPFQSEYPGDREWNRNAARFRFLPKEDIDDISYPHWNKILKHVGSGLDEAVSKDPWCRLNGIRTGADYLMLWISAMFQHPYEPTPYLFFFGPQNSGKSIFHEALSLLLMSGYVRADNTLSDTNYNGELEGAILCVIEETDLQHNKTAYNKIKDWVTAREISIHKKYSTPYNMRNTTHWVQCANSHRFCPIFKGDTRITMSYVDSLQMLEIIPKRSLIEKLEKEAPDFLTACLNLEIPKSNDRLMVPVIGTSEKEAVAHSNQNDLERFIEGNTHYSPGYWIRFGEFYDRFISTIAPMDMGYWTKIRVGKELPPRYPKGRNRKDGQFFIGNISWEPTEPRDKKYVIAGDYLELV